MKKYSIILVILCISCTSQKKEKKIEIGQKSVTYVDKSRNRPVVTEIWYPTHDKFVKKDSVTKKLPFKSMEVIIDASIPNKKFPLLLVSHGTGGNRFSLTWFVEKMVREGYMVVALDHYGNSTFNKIPREFVKWWERAIDVKFLLNSLLKDKTFGKKIDSTKIGFAGFSLGGYTAVALAGGYLDRDMSKVSEADRKLPDEFPKTNEVIDVINDSLIVASFNKYKNDVKDNRIKAFFTMAPAIGFAFHSKEQTKEITAPIFIVAGKGDTNTPIERNALRFHDLISTSKIHLFNENVNHYVFLNEGTEFGKKILPEITIDHPEVNRKEIHNKTTSLAIDFFKNNL